jgi:hypothetical protein
MGAHFWWDVGPSDKNTLDWRSDRTGVSVKTFWIKNSDNSVCEEKTLNSFQHSFNFGIDFRVKWVDIGEVVFAINNVFYQINLNF